jgi:hypothetical protein
VSSDQFLDGEVVLFSTLLATSLVLVGLVHAFVTVNVKFAPLEREFVKAKVSNHLWSFEELVELIDRDIANRARESA